MTRVQSHLLFGLLVGILFAGGARPLSAQSTPTRAENARTCLTGRYRALCRYDWLTAEEREQVRRSERRVNEETCVSGKYRALCRYEELSPEARAATAAAERRENLATCSAGKYEALCRYNELTPSELDQVRAAKRRENLATCLVGAYAALCDKTVLWGTERRRVDSAEARASANIVRGQGSARVTPEADSRARLSARASDACIEGTIRTPAPFMGNNNEVFRLDDGSLWQVQFEYEYLYAYYPTVVVCPKQGFMIVEKKKLQVRSLQSSPSTSTVAPQPSEDPTATPAVVESRIDGDFEGWDGDTVFRLQNGQIWQQVGAGITVHYKYSPKVLIYKSGARYKLRVDGVDREIAVERIK